MKRLLTSCFGLGWLPLCPGTWGSLPPAVIFALMGWFGAPLGTTLFVMIFLAVSASFICIIFSPFVIEVTGSIDPAEIVVDELAGQAVTYLVFLIVAAGRFPEVPVWGTAAVGFVLFRIFDIIKPWSIYRLQNLPKGWGILADDLLAGVYAAVSLLLVQSVWALYSVGFNSLKI